MAVPSIYTLRRRALPNQRRQQPVAEIQEKDRLRLNLEQRRLEGLKESWRVAR